MSPIVRPAAGPEPRLARALRHPLGQLARRFGAFGSAELAIRAVRLATTIVIARRLAPEIVGEAALALTVFELIRVLERTGTGQEIIRAPEAGLARVCNSVQRFYIGWTGCLIALQLGVAAAMAWASERATAAAMVAVLALVWPFMAGGHVQYFLLQRQQRAGRAAFINAAQVIADQLLTFTLLLCWASPWSIVLPKLLTAPLWLVLTRRAMPWRPDPAAGYRPMRGILRHAGKYLLSDGFSAIRGYGDNLIIAATMGTRALGTYYFAFNAGIGIVSSLIGAFATVAFPMLCAAPAGRARAAALRHVVLAGAALFVPLAAGQALLAPVYVPLVFGRHWAFAAPLIATLSLTGVPLLLSALTTTWLRATDRAGVDAFGAILACGAALGGLTIGALSGSLRAAVIGLLCGHALAAAITAARFLLPALIARPSVRQSRELLA